MTRKIKQYKSQLPAKDCGGGQDGTFGYLVAKYPSLLLQLPCGFQQYNCFPSEGNSLMGIPKRGDPMGLGDSTSDTLTTLLARRWSLAGLRMIGQPMCPRMSVRIASNRTFRQHGRHREDPEPWRSLCSCSSRLSFSSGCLDIGSGSK